MYTENSIAKFKGFKMKKKLTREYLRHLYARVDNETTAMTKIDIWYQVPICSLDVWVVKINNDE